MKTIKGVKAFDKGLICRGVQFEENKTFTFKGNPIICHQGYHFCENPMDVLDYYDLTTCEFAEVESMGQIDKEEKISKISTNKLKIGLKLDLKGFIKASFDFLWEKCKINDSGKMANSGYSGQMANSGDYGQMANSGYSGKMANSGDYGKMANSGSSGQMANSGSSGKMANSGDYGKMANSGDYGKMANSGSSGQMANSGSSGKMANSGSSGKMANSGDSGQMANSGSYGKMANSGDYGKMANSGDYGQIESTGNNCVCANIGISGIIKASIGTWITLAEYDNNGKCIFVKSAKIDGRKIKADVWLKLENKKIVEVEK